MYQAIFFALFPEIRTWQEIKIQEARRNRVLYNLQGFGRRCEQLFNDTYERELISWTPQSTVACITHDAIIDIDQYIQDHALAWSVDNNKHDSLTVQCPTSEVEDALNVTEIAIERWLTNFEGIRFQMQSDERVSGSLA